MPLCCVKPIVSRTLPPVTLACSPLNQKMYAHTPAHAHTRARTHTHTHTHPYARTHARTHTQTSAHTHTHKSKHTTHETSRTCMQIHALSVLSANARSSTASSLKELQIMAVSQERSGPSMFKTEESCTYAIHDIMPRSTCPYCLPGPMPPQYRRSRF